MAEGSEKSIARDYDDSLACKILYASSSGIHSCTNQTKPTIPMDPKELSRQISTSRILKPI
jgi:hypothetical protein